MVLARTATAATSAPASPPEESADALLTVEQAAERLGVAPSWLYRHWKSVPGAKKLGHRTLRFGVRALERWIVSRSVA